METEIQVIKLGAYGKAYDMPEARRAYTFVEQPGNVEAGKLGRALTAANNEKFGDSIDKGLSLLKALAEQGYGVFELPK